MFEFVLLPAASGFVHACPTDAKLAVENRQVAPQAAIDIRAITVSDNISLLMVNSGIVLLLLFPGT